MHNGVKTNILRVNEILCTYYNHSITQINSFNGYQNLGFSDIVIMNPAQNMPISPYSKTNNLGSLNSYIIVDYYSVKELFSAIQSFLFLGNINIEQKCVVSKKRVLQIVIALNLTIVIYIIHTNIFEWKI